MAEIMRKFKVILVVLLIFSCNDSEQSKKEKVAYNKFNTDAKKYSEINSISWT